MYKINSAQYCVTATIAVTWRTVLMSSAFLWRSSVPLSATDLLAPDNQCIHHLFERQVKATPDAIALLFEDEQISYRQLDQRINYLAYYLQCQGVGPEVVVGLYLERSIDMVISLLAILKAGGAYVPLDPGHPTERLKFIMQDARINIVITQRELATSVAVPIPHIIIVNDKHSTRQRDEISEITSLACDLNLAYVIYTSGSTGKPKGVQLFHRGVINFLLQMRQKLRITSTDKVLAITTLSFDIAVLELLLPLIVGACSVIVPRDTSTDGQQLAKKLRSSGATIMQATPTTWHLLLEAEWQDGQQLTMLCGGEALLPELARRLLSCGKDLWNLYGPTEATVWATIYKVEGVARILPIGFPIRNMEILILDKDLQAAPEGAIGELYISGVGVARGYLNRPDLTAERFVPNPFSQKPGERLYKTGDLARLQANGSIEFLGRNDQQVKVHGYRIELGEIEAVLTQYPDISNGVVIVQGETSEEKYLVAYLIAKQAHAFRPGELRKFLLERLPHYMIPAKFVLLEALPLTPNGKVDRKALPRPENVRHKPLVAPRNALEESIAAIWQDILRVESISIEDNFFEIGGHSLLATRIVARIREAFGIEVSLSNLLLCPVLMQFAQLVEQTLRTKQEERSKTLPVAVPENVSAPLSFTQQALWLFSTLEPENIAYNLPYAYRLKGPLSIWALEQSLQEIMQRHQILRTSFEISGSEPVQLVLDDCKLLFQVVDLLSLSTDARSHIAIELMRMMSRRLFDLSSGPLFRIALFRLGFQEHLLLFTFHHSISDDWSMEVLLQELAMLYPAFVRRETPALSPLPFQYSDFARGQRQWLPDNLASELAYWKEQLDGAPSFLELPTDRPRPSMQTYNGARVALTLPDSLYRPLQDLSNQEGATLFMTLLTAYKILLAYYSGQWEIVVGAAISGRDQPEVERLIGYFVNTLVLRTNLSDRPSFRKALSRVREVCLQAYAHPHVPLDYLVDAVHAERNLSYNSLFQVSFALATFPLDQIEMADVSLQSIEIDNGTVQCDLQMWLTQANKGITGYIEYNTDLFDASTAVRMCQHFHVLLEKIVAQPDIPLSEITLLSSVEQRTILYDWNTTQTAYAQDSCLHQIFEVRAEAMPEAIALIFGSQHMSYGELNRRANQLAHYLQDQGVGPDVLVGLCLERSVEMIVAVLAILKAGGLMCPLTLNIRQSDYSSLCKIPL
ncbi:amino acid adenylation domain-containing protein [Ktedonosporobacter rubrisoli]|uniref:Amino acid adenylation domain-containing protein n=1 Tax=Ktedonosporobacter rubrisoli TaxID=2509675 RepID=A0A4P6JR28_KTERU|nr:amino acid adenylation domain-containing protein [Ktedonosporobacter rubrisoli]